MRAAAAVEEEGCGAVSTGWPVFRSTSPLKPPKPLVVVVAPGTTMLVVEDSEQVRVRRPLPRTVVARLATMSRDKGSTNMDELRGIFDRTLHAPSNLQIDKVDLR